MKNRGLLIGTFMLASTYLGCGNLDSTLLHSSKDAEPEAIQIPLTADHVSVIYDGEGSVDFNLDHIDISPKVAVAANETHAGLILFKVTQDKPVKDFEFTLEMETTQQLRQNSSPNEWEVAWLTFGYTGQATEKTANYFTSKPNAGSELGLMQGKLGQKFLATDSGATTSIGSRHIYVFKRKDSVFSVRRDGHLLFTFNESSAFPQKLYDNKGAIGVYSEDAQVKIYSATFKNLDSSRTPASTATTPLLADTTFVKSPYSSVPLQVGVSNFLDTAKLLWSCTFIKAFGDLSSSFGTDCLFKGQFNSSGGFTWSPAITDIGSWFFDFEASEVNSGFSHKTYYTQVRPTWSASPLFLFDPQFAIRKTVNSISYPLTRDLNTENEKTNPWPDLISSSSLDISGLNEVSPWRTDADTGLTALHFDGNQNVAGLPFSIANLGTTQDIRLSYWFKRDSTNSKAALLLEHSNGNLQSRHWFQRFSSSYFDGATETTCFSTNDVTDTWTYVTTQVQAGQLKTFVNGREECTVALPQTYNFSSTLSIGPKVETFFSFDGSLSEIAGYKTSSAADIFNDFANTAERYRSVKLGPIENTGLALHWDIANGNEGMRVPASATVYKVADLTTTQFSKIVGPFDGTTNSGFDTTTANRSSLSFDGVDDYIEIDSHADLAIGPTWTIEAWLQPGVAKGYDSNYPITDMRAPLFKSVFAKATYDNANKLSNGVGLWIGADNTVDAYVVNNYGSTRTVKGDLVLNPTQWYHVAVTFDKATGVMKSFVNGVLHGTQVVDFKVDSADQPQADGDIIAGQSHSFIGVPFDVDSRRFFNGKLAVLRVYNTALSDGKILKQCQAQKQRFGVSCL